MSVLLFPVQDLMLLEHRLSAITPIAPGWGAAWAAVNRAAYNASYTPKLRREINLDQRHADRTPGVLWGLDEDEPGSRERDLKALRYNAVDRAGRNHASLTMLRDLDALEQELSAQEADRGAPPSREESLPASNLKPLQSPFCPTRGPACPTPL